MEDPSWLQRMASSPTRYGRSVSDRILDILSRILNKKYPKAEDITENELLEWKMWPSFFGMIGNHLRVAVRPMLKSIRWVMHIILNIVHHDN